MSDAPEVTVERWDLYEVALAGPRTGNPFAEVDLFASFRHKHRSVEVDGFYDGDGVYRVRFMPDVMGRWSYSTWSNCPDLDGQSGTFVCGEPSPENHGPVTLRNSYHFEYMDGAPYKQVGTTCYAWTHQGDALEARTLETLAAAPFNKLRMCVFPKHYAFNQNEPEHFPYERGADGRWDFTRFDPAFWRHLETRVGQLRDLGIEADVILFHPYDRWGFATMDAESDDRYLRYVVARLAAYRNVWWSLANEWDLMRSKKVADWDQLFKVVQDCDPYARPRSIHNCHDFYDHLKPWVTHLSVQSSDVEQTAVWRQQYRKPVMIDECCYEGNIPQRWGSIPAEEMVRRFWEGTVRGGYVGHGETYLHPEDVLWWSKGGVLHGQSPARLAFLRAVLEEGPAEGIDPLDGVVGHRYPCAGRPGEYYLIYFGIHQPARVALTLPGGVTFSAEVLDTWNMTATPVDRALSGETTIDLPGRPYVALRITRR